MIGQFQELFHKIIVTYFHFFYDKGGFFEKLFPKFPKFRNSSCPLEHTKITFAFHFGYAKILELESLILSLDTGFPISFCHLSYSFKTRKLSKIYGDPSIL